MVKNTLGQKYTNFVLFYTFTSDQQFTNEQI